MSIDIISSHQLQAYDEILQQINIEFEKSKRLKKEIRQAEDTVVVLKLSLENYETKISYVNVKIFSNIVEMLNLYECDINYCEVQDFMKCNYCNFFLVEIILTKTFLEKLADSDHKWKLHVNVRTKSACCSKTVPLTNKNSTFVVIPTVFDTYEAVVETLLFCYSGEQWNIVDLNYVDVDVSYYFETHKDKCNSQTQNFFNITKLYNKDTDLPVVQPSAQVQNYFKFSSDKSKFVEIFVRNCYHRFNLELFSEFVNDSRHIADVQFFIGDKQVTVLYNKDTNVLKVKCAPWEMYFIKNFLLKHSEYNLEEFRKKFKVATRKRSVIPDMDRVELLSLYEEIRKIWL